MRNTLVVSIALLLGSTSSLPAWSAPVAASAPAIAPMPLDQALELFARNSGLQLMYDPALAAGQRSNGAPAGLAPAQQLQKLLAGTGLDYRMPTPTTVSIVRSAAPAQRSAAAPRAPHAAATPAADNGDRDDGPRELAPINVTANSVDTLAPSAAPLEASQPTSVIDERFIRDGLRLNANYDDII